MNESLSGRKCEVCGKRFYIPSEDYVFKRYRGHGKDHRRVYFCGWTCMRKWDAEHKMKRGRNKQADYG